MQSKVFSTNKTLRTGSGLIDLATPKVMGILNVTPDSFYDGGMHHGEKYILSKAGSMLEEGACLIDVGGCSSRPGAEVVLPEVEAERVIPAIRSIIKAFPHALISVDTFRAEIARMALDEGAVMVNDISGGELDSDMYDLILRRNIPYILMHMRGTPQNMTSQTHYSDLLKDVTGYFHTKIKHLQALGATDLMIDPGFGFAKTREQSFELLKKLPYLKILGVPIVVGLSRKSLIWKTLETAAVEALNGTTALHTVALLKGANLLRVHDVKQAVEVVKLVKFVM